MRGALVGEGDHRLLYTYEPWSFRVGMILTAAGLANHRATLDPRTAAKAEWRRVRKEPRGLSTVSVRVRA